MSDDLRDPNKAVDKNAEAPTNKVKFAAESVANTPINRASNVKIAQRPQCSDCGRQANDAAAVNMIDFPTTEYDRLPDN